VCNLIKFKSCRLAASKPHQLYADKGIDLATVKEAGNELRLAYQILSQADEEDMVDYAVFTVKAAEKRYGYLLKKYKQQEKQELLRTKGGNI